MLRIRCVRMQLRHRTEYFAHGWRQVARETRTSSRYACTKIAVWKFDPAFTTACPLFSTSATMVAGWTRLRRICSGRAIRIASSASKGFTSDASLLRTCAR